jgi:cation diffusion facilitator CzcD-associated flavoprotein CzcO
MSHQWDVIIIGSGPSGILTALNLRSLGIRPLVIEKGDDIAWSWKNRANIGPLFTPPPRALRRFAPAPRKGLSSATSDAWHALLKSICSQHNIDVVCREAVHAVTHYDSSWGVETASRDLRAKAVVICTGAHSKTRKSLASDDSIPLYQTLDFQPDTRDWRRTLVVGAGTSGCEIARQVSTVAGTTAISVRTLPVVLPQKILGMAVVDLARPAHYLPDFILDLAGSMSEWAAFGAIPWRVAAPKHRLSERRSSKFSPTIDLGFVRALKSGRIRVLAEACSIAEGQVSFADGTRESFDAVIQATGYEPDLSILSREKRPFSPGLFFVGLGAHIEGFLHSMPVESKMLARAIKSHITRESEGGRIRSDTNQPERTAEVR